MEEEDFKTRLKSAKNKAKSKYSESKEPSTSGMGHAFKMSTELVAAVAVGTIIGFILDNWFGTKPCLLYTSPSPRDRYISRMPSSA